MPKLDPPEQDWPDWRVGEPAIVSVINPFQGRYAFLSSFYPRRIVWQGETWPDNEHPFQAAKTVNSAERDRVRAAATAKLAKQEGRRVTLRADWERVKFNTMLELCRVKFTPTDDEEDLAARLVATAPALLVEGNTWHDQVWGDCRCGRARCEAPGTNLLGLALMVVRAELINRVSVDA
jgi:ribA/ribD-fused uncharacterized protein